MTETSFHLLRRLPLFNCVADEDLFQLSRATHREHHPMGCEILSFGQKTPAVFVLISGTLKVCQPVSHDDLVVLNILGPDEILGEVNFLDGDGHSANVGTIERSWLLRIEQQALSNLCISAPALRQALVGLSLQRFRLASQRQAMFASCCLLRRTAFLLLEFASRYAPPQQHEVAIPFRLIQSDIASLAGGTRQRVGECLQNLEKAQLIRITKRYQITITDRPRLQLITESARFANAKALPAKPLA